MNLEHTRTTSSNNYNYIFRSNQVHLNTVLLYTSWLCCGTPARPPPVQIRHDGTPINVFDRCLHSLYVWNSPAKIPSSFAWVSMGVSIIYELLRYYDVFLLKGTRIDEDLTQNDEYSPEGLELLLIQYYQVNIQLLFIQHQYRNSTLVSSYYSCSSNATYTWTLPWDIGHMLSFSSWPSWQLVVLTRLPK